MTLSERSVTALLDAFSSSEPTPGGGSASALAGAVGASLLAMVSGLPKNRAASDRDRAALAGAHDALLVLRDALRSLIDRDSEAYGLVVAAYRRPKGTQSEQAERKDAIQEALRQAIATPVEMMRAASAALGHAATVARHGQASASSDVRVALDLLGAALRGARLNVEINLEHVTDPAYVEQARSEVARLSDAAPAIAQAADAWLPVV